MGLRQELDAGRQRWRRLTVYLKFEHAVVLVLTILISVIIVLAIWKLAVKILYSLARIIHETAGENGGSGTNH